MVAFNASRSKPPSTKVEYAFQLRHDQEMAGYEAKLHPVLLGYFTELPKSLTFGEFERMTGEDPAELSAKILKPSEMTNMRRDLAASLMQRQAIAGLTPVGSA